MSETHDVESGTATVTAVGASTHTSSESSNGSGGGTRRRTAGLSSKLLPELQQLAGDLGISGTAKLRKNQLIEAIQAAQSGGKAGSVTEPARADADATTRTRAAGNGRRESASSQAGRTDAPARETQQRDNQRDGQQRDGQQRDRGDRNQRQGGQGNQGGNRGNSGSSQANQANQTNQNSQNSQNNGGQGNSGQGGPRDDDEFGGNRGRRGRFRERNRGRGGTGRERFGQQGEPDPVISDDGPLIGHYGVTGYPETFFIDRHGRVIPLPHNTTGQVGHIIGAATPALLDLGIKNALSK